MRGVSRCYHLAPLERRKETTVGSAGAAFYGEAGLIESRQVLPLPGLSAGTVPQRLRLAWCWRRRWVLAFFGGSSPSGGAAMEMLLLQPLG